METSQVIDWSREALRLSLQMGGPLLAVALVVGLVVGVGQTLTQLHEPVVGQVPRMVVVVLATLAPCRGWSAVGVVHRPADRVDPQSDRRDVERISHQPFSPEMEIRMPPSFTAWIVSHAGGVRAGVREGGGSGVGGPRPGDARARQPVPAAAGRAAGSDPCSRHPGACERRGLALARLAGGGGGVRGRGAGGGGLGWSAALIVAGARQAGELVGSQAGLAPAALFNPEAGDEMTALGHLYGLVALGVFLALDGPLALVRALVESYRVIPPGGGVSSLTLTEGTAALAFERVGEALALSLRAAAPVALALALAGVALGLLGRAAPSLQLLALAMPVRLALGLVLVLVGLAGLAATLAAAWGAWPGLT